MSTPQSRSVNALPRTPVASSDQAARPVLTLVDEEPHRTTARFQAVRGSTSRLQDHKEQFQVGLVRAIAAASGAIVMTSSIDDGIDLELVHKSPSHARDEARIQVQLKATTSRPTRVGVPASLEKKRYNALNITDPSIHKILIVMMIPSTQRDWIRFTDEQILLRKQSYWVNLAGLPNATGGKKRAVAPFTQLFDDVALCAMMARVGQGLAP
ncbi:DUF4365 domain-containing protein [Clavibacter michiganensis]|uniref:DUF4365 domain-containing protein n=1 Tax=Clavibacter michiganensis TaxID=28447 RepID=UPI001C64F5ED|nr:DUF4365 domain-containing protein [Clavibacter michiganensis]